MLEAMLRAELGDDVLEGDPTVRRLERAYAEWVGKDGALYLPSGTMANQIAVGVWTRPGEELVAYRDLDDLERQLDYYLAHPDEARAIGANAHTRALKEHTLRHRIEAMLAVMADRFGRTS